MADETLNIRITADVNQAKQGLSGLGGMLGNLGGTLKTGLMIGAGAAVAGIGALAVGLTESVKAAMGAEEVQAQLAAVLKSTGGAAGVSADMANALASSLQNVTRFEDDAILSGENMLLTFTNIGKDIFPDVTKTMLDMSQAMGQDVKSSAIQLGKALNDPIAGMSALSRVGVSFTEEQKAQIEALQKSGDLMGAQKIILAELQKEFGGAAEAAGNTFAGKLDILQNKFGDIMETIGGALIPVLTEGASALLAFMNDPAIQAGVQALAQGFASIAQNVVGFIANLTSGGGGDFLGGMIAGIQSTFQSLMDWLTGSLGPALSAAFAQISEAAGPALQMLAGWINGTVLPALQQLGAWLGPILAQGFAQLGEFIVKQAIPALTQLAVWIVGTVLPAVGTLAMQIGGVLNDAFRSAGQLWQILLIGFQKAGQFIDDAKANLLALAEALIGPVASAFQWFMTNVLDPIKEALAALRMWISLTIDALNKLGGFVGVGIPNPFGGARAAGGPVSAGMPYLVGERGPELFVPRGNGTIVPNNAIGGAVNVYVTYAPTVSLMDQSEARDRLAPLIREALAMA